MVLLTQSPLGTAVSCPSLFLKGPQCPSKDLQSLSVSHAPTLCHLRGLDIPLGTVTAVTFSLWFCLSLAVCPLMSRSYNLSLSMTSAYHCLCLMNSLSLHECQGLETGKQISCRVVLKKQHGSLDRENEGTRDNLREEKG